MERAPDEGELLSSVLSGDRAAAEELVSRTYKTIYASLFKLCGGNADLAADLTQETYQRAWAALGRFGGRSQISTWLYRIAYTTFLNHIRRPARVVSIDDDFAVEVRDPAAGAEDLLSRKEDETRLRKAVLGLPEELRFTVSAHYWGNLPVKEIARMEEVTGAAIRKRLRKAMAVLEVALDEDSR